jgi:hypothetical protein
MVMVLQLVPEKRWHESTIDWSWSDLQWPLARSRDKKGYVRRAGQM